jgi:hypothetical protein
MKVALVTSLNLYKASLCVMTLYMLFQFSDDRGRSDPNYHGKSDVHQRGGIPVHRNESISISDMEK